MEPRLQCTRVYTCTCTYMYELLQGYTIKQIWRNIVHNYGNRVGVLRCSCVYMLCECL